MGSFKGSFEGCFKGSFMGYHKGSYMGGGGLIAQAIIVLHILETRRTFYYIGS